MLTRLLLLGGVLLPVLAGAAPPAPVPMALADRRPADPRFEAAPRLVVPPAPLVPRREPPPAGEDPAPEDAPPDGAPAPGPPRFLDGPETDDKILDRICGLPLRSVSPLGGGASISLKVTFEDGARAAVKPNQLHVTRYRSEVAAYWVARALGLRNVAPSCVRRFPKEVLIHPGLPGSLFRRMEEEVSIDSDGYVATAVIHWVPDLRGLRLEKQTWWLPLLRRDAPWPADPAKRRRLLEISTLLLFDFLILNTDRWSGGNTHTSGDRMVYLDQGAGFGRERRGARAYVRRYLQKSQRFDRQVAAALLDLDVPQLRRTLRSLLSDREQDELEDRIAEAQRYLRGLAEAAPEDSLY